MTIGPSRPRAGFTLIEVAFSLLLVSVGVISVMLILPMGVTAQVRSRQQTLATAIAVNLVDMAYNQPLAKWLRTPIGGFKTKFTHPVTSEDYYIPFVPDVNFIGTLMGDVKYGPLQVNPLKAKDSPSGEKDYYTARRYSTLYPDPVVHAPDLETIVNTYYHGVFALPTEIARRIDSPGDEISRVLDLGGHLYFIGPRGPTFQAAPVGPDGKYGWPTSERIPDEVQNLVFAVVGFPQRNAELFCMDGMFPGYVDLRQNFPRAIRLYPPGPGQADNKPAHEPSTPLAEPAAPYGPKVPFQPAERCRQIVFWRVDWRSYADCENATLATADRYRYPGLDASQFSAPEGKSLMNEQDMAEVGKRVMPPDAHDPQYFRAERWMTYPGDSEFTAELAWDSGYLTSGANVWQDTYYWDRIRNGMNGADLNGNRILDRGPTDSSRRLRAELVTRFNFYDPRVWLSINKPLPADAPIIKLPRYPKVGP